MTVITLEPVTMLKVAPDQILAQKVVLPKAPADPCIIDGVSEGFSDEPITEYQDSMDAAGYPYW